MPTRDDVEAIMAEARKMRAQVLRNGVARFWSMLHRNLSAKTAPQSAAEA